MIPIFSTRMTEYTFKYAPHYTLEQFTNECHKTRAKVITLTNHNRNKNQNEPITNRSKCKKLVSSPGKCMRASHDWFWFNLSLVEKAAQAFLTNQRSKLSKHITFDTELKTTLS